MPVPTLEFYRALVDSLDSAVLVADDSATYREANTSACRLLERERSEIIGHHLSEFVLDGTRELVDAQWRAFLRDGAQSGVFPLKLGPGSVVSVEFNAHANVMPGFHCSFLTRVVTPSAERAEGLLTVCAWTHRVQWKGGWVAMETYLREAHGVMVSHGMCPDVFARMYGEPAGD
jgi:PAS domain S-box-containing protein